MMNYFLENWPVLSIAFAGVVAVIGTFFSSSQDEELKDSIRQPVEGNKISRYISKNWPTLLIAIAGIIAVIATFVGSNQDAAQKNNIEKLGRETVKLDTQIMKLDDLNRDISMRNEALAGQNFKLDSESKGLVSQVKGLTEQSQKLIQVINQRIANEAAENLVSGQLHMDFKPTFQDSVMIKMGASPYKFSFKSLKNGASRLCMVGQKDPLQIKTHNKKIQLSLMVYDLQGFLLAEIANNNWRPNKNYVGRFNYDDRGFEVEDNKGNVVVSIDITGDNQLVIQGIFPLKSEGVILVAGVKEFKILQMENPESALIAENVKMKELFEYTGEDWLHKRKKYN